LMKIRQRSVVSIAKVRKMAKKRISSLVIHYIRVKKIFVPMRTFWVSKEAEFYVEFKNINFS
jgi:hypothetical protein